MKVKLSLLGVLMSLFSWAAVHNISVTAPTFTPSSLTINQGDVVIWTNAPGGGAHNVNGTQATFSGNPASFGNSVGTDWTYQYTFNVPGVYNYQCDPHAASGMTGTITVNPAPVSSDLIITGVFDGPLSGGTPKGVELYVVNNISDLSIYGISSANNGNGATGTPEFTFPTGSATAGSFIYLASTSADFSAYFGFAPDYVDGTANINGDDAIELFMNGSVVDVYGDVNTDGTGTAWDYVDGWSYRVNNTGPDGSTFVPANWNFGGTDALDGTTTNAGATNPFPIGTFTLGTVNPPVSGIPTYNISQITTSNANGVADSLNAEVRVHGVVYSIDFDGNNGYSFFIYDNTGGINIYSGSDVSNYTNPQIGDSIRVIGEVDQFNGLTELVPDSIVLFSSANNLTQPTTAFTVSENTEGDYIKLRSYWLLDPSQWPASGSSASVDITNGTDTTILRIDSDTDIDGSAAPTGIINITGAGGQYDFSSPYTSGYQIQPSSLNDIEAVVPGNIPHYSIASVTTNNANGLADSVGVEMELRGVVYSIDFDGNAGYSLFMYDATGGINVFSTSNRNNYTNPLPGDSISVIGEIDQYNGLTEILADSIVLWSRNVALKNPTVVTDLDETTEGDYVRLNGFSVVTPSQWPSSGSSANVDITDGNVTLTMRIDSDTDIDGTTVPSGQFDVIGAGSQFDPSSPFFDGYQVLPSSLNDIIPAPPANPTANFALTSVTGSEALGTLTVDILVNPTSSTNDTVYMQVIPGSGVTLSDGNLNPTPNPLTGIFPVWVPANQDSASFTIQIMDDAVIEGNETLFVNMVNVSAGLLIGSNDNFELVITDNDAPAPAIPTYSIADLTGNDANGEADSLGVYAKIHGVVYTDDFDGNAGYSFYMYDNTGGVNVFNFVDVSGYAVERGDSLRIVGSVDQYNGLTEFVADSIVILDSNLTLKAPAVVTTLNESTEGEYIRMNGMTLVTPSQWPAAGSSGNVDITNGTVTVTMRIVSSTDIDGTPAPTGAFDVIGAGGQFDGTSPYTSGYQIFPRDLNDIIPVVATSPTVNFASAIQTVLEDAGTITVNLPINPVSTSSETIKVYVNNGFGVTSADYSTTPAAVTDTITLTAAANASSVSFDVTITDDAIQEGTEMVSFSIGKTSAGLQIGAVDSYVLSIQDNDTPIPTYEIAVLTTNDAQGVSDSAGVYARVTGIVFTPDFDMGTARSSFYIYDNTGGINIFTPNASLINYIVTPGDSISAVGEVTNYNGLTELIIDSVRVLSSGHTIKAPLVVNVPNESTESELIRMNGVWLTTPSQWPTVPGGSSNVEITNGTDTTILRIDSDVSSLNGSPAPVGIFDVVGVGGQFDSSVPHDEGYQIMPRDINDIIVFIPTLAITEIMPSSNQPSPVNGDWFEVTNYGPDPIDMNGYSWDDDGQVVGAHDITSSYIINPGESVIFLQAVHPDDSAWLYTWSQTANGLKVIDETDFGGIGFSNLGSGGDEVNLYNEHGALIQRAVYTGSDVTAGISLQYDTTGTLIGKSVNGQDGAYTSGTGDVGNPGNMSPVSISEFIGMDLEVYPNPATASVTINTENYEVKTISVYSVNGHKLVEINSSDPKVVLNVENLPSGVYILQVNSTGMPATARLIVE